MDDQIQSEFKEGARIAVGFFILWALGAFAACGIL